MRKSIDDKVYTECGILEFCSHVSRPEIPSPSGGAVVGVVGALLASLLELVLRVTEKHSNDVEAEKWAECAAEARELRGNLLRFAEQDVQDTAKLLEGHGPACVRKQVAAPAKIASGLVKILRLLERVAGNVHDSVRSDVLAIAALGRGAAQAIFYIEKADIEWGGGGDDALLQRITEWRDQACESADRILDKVREI